MRDDAEYVYDVATALTQGRRACQEDAVETHFPKGGGLGFVVLADGMGGHAAGDVASRLVVDEVFAELNRQVADPASLETNIGAVLHAAVARANGQVARYTTRRPELRGMGATLVAPLVVGNRLYWISVGDSPLYLLRGHRMARLNQEHSMARRMEAMISRGEITRDEAENDPDRNCLTSVLFGAAIPEIDCRDLPLDIQEGDILIAASDGILYLDEERIATLVYDHRAQTSAEIGARLLEEIRTVDDPQQDNVSLCVLKVARQPRPAEAPVRPQSVTRTMLRLRLQRNGRRLAYDYSTANGG